ncbi:MAG TPA: HAD-IIIC family phosphatase [Reyranella sp.]|nr:HAD-IIIC family phosphatase [Reyranella sp.]
MKTLLLSNINMKPLVAALRPMEVVSGEYGSLLLDLVNPQSVAAGADIDRVLCLHDSDGLLGDALYGEDTPDQCEALIAALDGYCARQPGKIVVSHTFCFSSARWLTYADPLQPQSLRTRETALNDRLLALAKRTPNLVLIDLEGIVRRHGEAALYSPAFWYAGRIRYTSLGFRELATAVQQALDAYGNKAKKVLVLDLDNTLWGGIAGETGPMDIALSEEGAGRCYRDFQRALKALTRTGVLLAICSKNNPGDVDEVFERNPMMILRRGDFASLRVNWEPKPQNIADIAQVLDLGLDSFVFLDDNPVERSLMATTCPEVTVPDFPAKPEELPGWFRNVIVPRYFGKYVISAEDRNKTEQYRANEVRHGLAQKLDLDSFLAELGIDCTLHVNEPELIARAAQMTQKTNQFNLTTRRYQIPDVKRFVESPDHAVILLDYKDKFGSEGIVGLAILDLTEGRFDTFLMSCRVIGRKVEDRIIAKAGELVRAHGGTKLIGELIPTRKNGLVASFFEDHGFAVVKAEPDGHKIYEKALA